MTGFSRAARDSAAAALAASALERLELEAPRAERALGRDFLVLEGSSLAALAERAFSSIQYRLRPDYLRQLASVAWDDDADGRDRFTARALLDNARLASRGVLPLCQDTGTAAVYAWKGERVLVDRGARGVEIGDGTDDEDLLAAGALAAWKAGRLRNSQVAPLRDFGERNTGDNAPLSCEIFAAPGEAYRFLFVAKGGGSSNKTALFQETKRLLEPAAFADFAAAAIAGLGVSACPPYRVAVILGGQSPEEAVLVAKLAGSGALDALPLSAGEDGAPYRDPALEAVIMKAAADSGLGAQFGGRFLARDARVVRLPRHAASLPVVVAVSCAAHRQAWGLATREGWFLERLASEADIDALEEAASAGSPARATRAAPKAAPPAADSPFGKPRRLDLGDCSTVEARASILSLRAGDFVELWGTVVLARDAAHARLRAILRKGGSLPAWTRYAAFYASPTETPEGLPVGSLGPTTSKRMDSYMEDFLARGVFTVSLGKGERGPECAAACARHGGAYLATLGGAAALAASRHVASSRVVDWDDLGMEAIRLVELRGLPAIVAVDAEGREYYRGLARADDRGPAGELTRS